MPTKTEWQNLKNCTGKSTTINKTKELNLGDVTHDPSRDAGVFHTYFTDSIKTITQNFCKYENFLLTVPKPMDVYGRVSVFIRIHQGAFSLSVSKIVNWSVNEGEFH